MFSSWFKYFVLQFCVDAVFIPSYQDIFTPSSVLWYIYAPSRHVLVHLHIFLAGEGHVWSVCCEFRVWFMFCLWHSNALYYSMNSVKFIIAYIEPCYDITILYWTSLWLIWDVPKWKCSSRGILMITYTFQYFPFAISDLGSSPSELDQFLIAGDMTPFVIKLSSDLYWYPDHMIVLTCLVFRVW